ncbi:ABC transporter permease [Cohnella thailandensis]|uniref:ABC transporter permease n=1 Tax=Cohnella thailandensis TaxID=557557 RepID=A0A841SS75_9BACL|nr:ABC transporter permease [Cohnella thailandensis]MBB6634062.1 ABC transporter permease [Cohnella thailandensis]MBP1972446.1 hypothetical protein [Cohnella thailandensis]
MPGFRRLLSSEWMKLSKSRVWLLVPVSPAIALLIGALVSFDSVSGSDRYPILLSAMGQFHAMFFLPILTGILAAFVCRYEHGSGGWKQLLSLPVSRTGVIAAKLLIIAVLLAAVQLLFAAAVYVASVIHGFAPELPWGALASAVAGSWLGCLPLAALQLGVSTLWSSFAAPLAVNVMLTLPNMLVANSEKIAPYYPWAQPALTMLRGDALDFGAFALPIESLLITVLGSFVIFLSASLVYFNRKEI